MKREGLTKGEAAVVRAALTSPNQAEGAKSARMSLRNYQRYLATDPVRAALKAAAIRRLHDVTIALARHAERATDVLGEMANGTLIPHGARVRACLGILEHVQRARQLEELETKIDELERRLGSGAAP